jgi:hypothetical protein
LPPQFKMGKTRETNIINFLKEMYYSSRVVTTVFKYKEELTECLNYIIENEDDKKPVRQSTGLINYLKDADFNF